MMWFSSCTFPSLPFSPPIACRPTVTYLKLRTDADVYRDHLGHSQFSIAGHDRGGRVAHRLTLDHPERVKRLMVLDIAPTLGAFEGMGYKSVCQLLFYLFLSLHSFTFPPSQYL